MPVEFRSKIDPGPELADRIADLTPGNPFYTSSYNEVRRRLGGTACALWLEENDRPVSGCSAFLNKGRLNSRLEITSLPFLSHPNIFWYGLFEFCRGEGISALSVHTFGSTESRIPANGFRMSLRKRGEYKLDLRQSDLFGAAHRLHQRKIKAASAAGLTIRSSSDVSARQSHVDLANLSLDRRRWRGYSIYSRIDLAETNAFVDTGAGAIYQAVLGNEVVSSVLIARGRTGGYAQSSGTSDSGRDLGASHFLFYKTACLLQGEGFETFNLGGADEESRGLQNFKLGLGGRRVDLESAEFYFGSGLKRIATRATARLFRG